MCLGRLLSCYVLAFCCSPAYLHAGAVPSNDSRLVTFCGSNPKLAEGGAAVLQPNYKVSWEQYPTPVTPEGAPRSGHQ